MPLIVKEATTDAVKAAYEDDPAMSVWWATEVECVSAVARLQRSGRLTAQQVIEALQRLDSLARTWQEVQPRQSVRRPAVRLLRVHNLRAADALQLAAALIASEGHPASLEFVTLDDRLVDAAQREGFRVVNFADRQA